jgi:hypothetical protein
VNELAELPIVFGTKPALATVAMPVANTALKISDRTIVFLRRVAAPRQHQNTSHDEPTLNRRFGAQWRNRFRNGEYFSPLPALKWCDGSHRVDAEYGVMFVHVSFGAER